MPLVKATWRASTVLGANPMESSSESSFPNDEFEKLQGLRRHLLLVEYLRAALDVIEEVLLHHGDFRIVRGANDRHLAALIADGHQNTTRKGCFALGIGELRREEIGR